MKFTVEVDDFWIEEGDLADALTQAIKSSVVNQITAAIDKKVDAQITSAIIKVIDSHVDITIKNKLSELVDTGTIVRDGKAIKITDHIQNVFVSSMGWNSPRDKIAELAKKFGEELKLRYDALFANRIVVKLNEQGMLKDEVVKLLIDSPTGK